MGLIFKCHCGICVLTAYVPLSPPPIPSTVRCHCRRCRLHTTSGFAAYLRIHPPESSHHALTTTLEALPTHRFAHACDWLGPVTRIACRFCFSKLATVPSSSADTGAAPILLHLGTLLDSSLPASLARLWQARHETRCAQAAARWWVGVPGAEARDLPRSRRRTQNLTCRCACGSVCLTTLAIPGEIQHCYCRMCRCFGGGVAQSWIPVPRKGPVDFDVKQAGLLVQRTSDVAVRLVCRLCAGVLVILYDEQPATAWIVAGGVSDGEWVPRTGTLLYRVCHIGVDWMPAWYLLPDDGLERTGNAG